MNTNISKNNSPQGLPAGMLMLCCGILLVCGCKKIDKLTHFTMDYSETVVIPSVTGINLPFNLITPPVETNSEYTFTVNNTDKDLIEEIRLTAAELTITSPNGANFDFLRSVTVYLSAEGLPETEIARKNPVPAGLTVLTLDVMGNDLQEYIKMDTISLRLNTETDELLMSDYHVCVHTVFFVDAKILGL